MIQNFESYSSVLLQPNFEKNLFSEFLDQVKRIYKIVPLRAVKTFKRKMVSRTDPFRIINIHQWPLMNLQ